MKVHINTPITDILTDQPIKDEKGVVQTAKMYILIALNTVLENPKEPFTPEQSSDRAKIIDKIKSAPDVVETLTDEERVKIKELVKKRFTPHEAGQVANLLTEIIAVDNAADNK